MFFISAIFRQRAHNVRPYGWDVYSMPIAHYKSICRAGCLIPPRRNLRQYRIILSADTASEVRQMPSQKRR